MYFKIEILLILWFCINSNTLNILESSEISCRDEHGNFVDWFYAYKLPGELKRIKKEIHSNVELLFVTADSRIDDWTISTKTIQEEDSIIGLTIKQAYTINSNRLVLAYSDQPPGRPSHPIGSYAKGLIVANSTHGFWLIHSVSKFPNVTDNPLKYRFPILQTLHGQNFLCISVDRLQIIEIAKQLLYIEPQMYHHNLSPELSKIYPEILYVLNKKEATKPPFERIRIIKSIGGVEFTSFAKTANWKKALFKDLVVPELNTCMLLKTWRHYNDEMEKPVECKELQRLYHVAELAIRTHMTNITNALILDDSKWAVGCDTDWICIGDSNRYKSPYGSGGGAICHYDALVANVYRKIIGGVVPCVNRTMV